MEVGRIAAQRKPMLIAITETHLDASFENGEVDIPGYMLIRQDRDPTKSRKKKQGGVMAYIQEDHKPEDIRYTCGLDFEMVAFTLQGDARFIVVYRPPGGSISEEAFKEIEKKPLACKGAQS